MGKAERWPLRFFNKKVKLDQEAIIQYKFT
jgi:hypothetical protein